MGALLHAAPASGASRSTSRAGCCAGWRPRSLAVRAAGIVIGVAACLFGNADDAPGLVLFGCLLIGATLALAVRTRLRSE